MSQPMEPVATAAREASPPTDSGPMPGRALAQRLALEANAARATILRMVADAGLGHLGGDLSVIDILTVLYGGILRIDPQRPRAADRDRLILSKGHATGALYATLARRGFFPESELATYMQPLSRLGGHPDCAKLPGVETNTGPLGHGFPVAVGTALAAKMSGLDYRTFVITGDGELQEGSNWEAAMAAAHFKLDNLVLTIDRNGLQQGDATERTMSLEPLGQRFAAFGFAVVEVDGHDHEALLSVYTRAPIEPGRPTCVLARTVKGKGVSFMENLAAWHHKVPSREQLQMALSQVNERPTASLEPLQ